jgi:hypothetical protein
MDSPEGPDQGLQISEMEQNKGQSAFTFDYLEKFDV